MRAAILAIGSELLGTEKLDTNSLRLTRIFERFGVDLVAKSVVGDRQEDIVREMRMRLDEADVLLVTGGLGPTKDDRTRAATAAAFGRGVEIHEQQVEILRAKFRSFGRSMPEVNRRQAAVIDGAVVLDNPRGSAPGQRVDIEGEGASSAKSVFLFPGVPIEVEGMIEHHLVPWLEAQGCGAEQLEHRVTKVACLPESQVEEMLAPVYQRFGADAVAVLASPAEVRIVGSARGDKSARQEALGPLMSAVREAMGKAVFTETGDHSLEAVVGDALVAAGHALVTAESCTGGLISERLTRVPGSSRWFSGGVVAYDDRVKIEQLDVSRALIVAHGAVSQEVVEAMAKGARERFRADIAVAVSGIAGPGGGTAEKPVGLVHLAVAGPGDEVHHRRVQIPGDRARVRQITSQVALDMVRRRLLFPAPVEVMS